jgi:hypothetical protein
MRRSKGFVNVIKCVEIFEGGVRREERAEERKQGTVPAAKPQEL